jgi:hypothetical protein
MTVALIAGVFTKIIDPKDFIVLASMVFTFYFSNKPVGSTGEIAK